MKKRFYLIALTIVAMIRRALESFLFKKWAPKNWEDLEDYEGSSTAFMLDEVAFDMYINGLPYLADPHGGLLDYSFPIDHPEYFFKKLPHGRDCDDWARIWSAYYRFHGKIVQEWIITTTTHPFKDSHFVAVLCDKGKYTLLDYSRWGSYDTPEDAVSAVCNHWERYSMEELIAVKYTTWGPK